jgi:oxygen-independent coproporphyrinogen-3 oxidase
MSKPPEISPSGAIEQTEVGSYFVANYPPFSVWSRDGVAADALPALETPPAPGIPLGMYLHIPFCRKRCHFCYFRVYTDKNADEVNAYLDSLVRELELYSQLPAVGGRQLDFVYFGGGTPSFLSTKQLDSLVSRLKAIMPWDNAEEVTFECEPGTLTETKLSAIRAMGVTRLSLGVENFDDRILELNGRAHRSPEVFKAYDFAQSLDFATINIDLISGMLGESDDTWRNSVEQTLKLSPDSVTIYQMELPYNTTISGDIIKGAGQFSEPVADWATKRRWVREAFDAFESAGYSVRTAYTAVKDADSRFVYTDRLWQGADMAGLGVSSFGHINGVHMQNLDKWQTYSESLDRGQIPLSRAYRPTDEERMIREFVLQLKRGSVRPDYFNDKYGVNVSERFADHLKTLESSGFVSRATKDEVALSREGLLRVDSLLPGFFRPEHSGIRYT